MKTEINITNILTLMLVMKKYGAKSKYLTGFMEALEWVLED